jgi:hypothetical protein
MKIPKGKPKNASGGPRDTAYPEDGVLREVSPKRQRAKSKNKMTRVRSGRKPYHAEDHEVKYDHPALYTGGYPPEIKIQAAVNYMIVGSFDKAGKMMGITGSTIANWAKNSEWWPAVTAQIRKERGDELDVCLTGVIHDGVATVADRLTGGDILFDKKTGEFYRQPIKGRDAAVITSIMFEKRALLRGDPTSRIEKISTEERLSKIQKEFKKFSKAKTIEVVPDDNEDTE